MFLKLGGFQVLCSGKIKSGCTLSLDPSCPKALLNWQSYPPLSPPESLQAASHHAKANPFFKALLEAAAIKRLSLPSLLWQRPRSGSDLQTSGSSKHKAFLSRIRGSDLALRALWLLLCSLLAFSAATLLLPTMPSASHSPVLAY